jgi:hypothetical protein
VLQPSNPIKLYTNLFTIAFVQSYTLQTLNEPGFVLNFEEGGEEGGV